jgi:hypothetical protein
MSRNHPAKLLIIPIIALAVSCGPGTSAENGAQADTTATAVEAHFATEGEPANLGNDLPEWVAALPKLTPNYRLTAAALNQPNARTLTPAEFEQLCPNQPAGVRAIAVGRIQFEDPNTSSTHIVVVATQNPTPAELEVSEYTTYLCA